MVYRLINHTGCWKNTTYKFFEFLSFCWHQLWLTLRASFSMSLYAFLWLIPLLGPLHNWTVNDFGCWVSSQSLWLRLASLCTHFTVCLMHCFVPGICLCDICVFFSWPSLGDLLLDSYSLLVIILLLHRNSSFSVTGAWVLWGLVAELQAVPAMWVVLH